MPAQGAIPTTFAKNAIAGFAADRTATFFRGDKATPLTAKGRLRNVDHILVADVKRPALFALQRAMKIEHLALLDAPYGSDKTHMPEVSERRRTTCFHDCLKHCGGPFKSNFARFLNCSSDCNGGSAPFQTHRHFRSLELRLIKLNELALKLRYGFLCSVDFADEWQTQLAIGTYLL